MLQTCGMHQIPDAAKLRRCADGNRRLRLSRAIDKRAQVVHSYFSGYAGGGKQRVVTRRESDGTDGVRSKERRRRGRDGRKEREIPFEARELYLRQVQLSVLPRNRLQDCWLVMGWIHGVCFIGAERENLLGKKGQKRERI